MHMQNHCSLLQVPVLHAGSSVAGQPSGGLPTHLEMVVGRLCGLAPIHILLDFVARWTDWTVFSAGFLQTLEDTLRSKNAEVCHFASWVKKKSDSPDIETRTLKDLKLR